MAAIEFRVLPESAWKELEAPKENPATGVVVIVGPLEAWNDYRARGLSEVLAQLDAAGDLREGIEELYAAAREAGYGGGLTKKGVRIVNNHVQDYVPDAIELARTYRAPKKPGRG